MMLDSVLIYQLVNTDISDRFSQDYLPGTYVSIMYLNISNKNLGDSRIFRRQSNF